MPVLGEVVSHTLIPKLFSCLDYDVSAFASVRANVPNDSLWGFFFEDHTCWVSLVRSAPRKGGQAFAFIYKIGLHFRNRREELRRGYRSENLGELYQSDDVELSFVWNDHLIVDYAAFACLGKIAVESLGRSRVSCAVWNHIFPHGYFC